MVSVILQGSEYYLDLKTNIEIPQIQRYEDVIIRNVFWEKKIDHILSEYETSDVNFWKA